jgi:hypothetical protein
VRDRKPKEVSSSGRKGESTSRPYPKVILNHEWLHRCVFVLLCENGLEIVDDLIDDIVDVRAAFHRTDAVYERDLLEARLADANTNLPPLVAL